MTDALHTESLAPLLTLRAACWTLVYVLLLIEDSLALCLETHGILALIIHVQSELRPGYALRSKTENQCPLQIARRHLPITVVALEQSPTEIDEILFAKCSTAP